MWARRLAGECSNSTLPKWTRSISHRPIWSVSSYSSFHTDHNDGLENFYSDQNFNYFLKSHQNTDFQTHLVRLWRRIIENSNVLYNICILVLLAGILQPPFFNASLPTILNYASMGLVVGHEVWTSIILYKNRIEQNIIWSQVMCIRAGSDFEHERNYESILRFVNNELLFYLNRFLIVSYLSWNSYYAKSANFSWLTHSTILALNSMRLGTWRIGGTRRLKRTSSTRLNASRNNTEISLWSMGKEHA